jgi:hypothetical protein
MQQPPTYPNLGVPGESTEQMRYYNRMKDAQYKQSQMFNIHMNQQHNAMLSKKEKMILKYEGTESGVPMSKEHTHNRVSRQRPLGMIVTQIEMNNPDSRKQLRDTLERQIKEKSMKKD